MLRSLTRRSLVNFTYAIDLQGENDAQEPHPALHRSSTSRPSNSWKASKREASPRRTYCEGCATKIGWTMIGWTKIDWLYPSEAHAIQRLEGG